MGKNQRCLILGCNGYLGSVLTRKMLALGYHVTGFDNLYRPSTNLNVLFHEYPKTFQFVKGDLTDLNFVKKLPWDDFDVCVNLVAIVGEPLARAFPALSYHVTVHGADNVVACINPKTKLVLCGTGSSYGSVEGICTEETPTNPLSKYGEHKLIQENSTRYHENHIILRLSTAFGASYNPRLRLLPHEFAYDALHGGIICYQPEFKRSFVHVSDITDAIITAAQSDVYSETLNCGHPDNNWTKRQLAEALSQKTGCPVFYGEGKDVDQRNYEISFEKIKKVLGWEARYSISDTFDEIINCAKLYKFKPEYDI